MKNKRFRKLLKTPLNECARPTKPMRTGNLGSEYMHGIMDYEQLDPRYKPYNATETHGIGCYNAIPEMIEQFKHKRILDLGCGSGELLETIKMVVPDIEGHGVTLNLAEVKSGIQKGFVVLPLDMRDIADYYDCCYFDCVILFQALQFVPHEDHEALLKSIHHVLRPGGQVWIMDYYSMDDSKLKADYRPAFCWDTTAEWKNGTMKIYEKLQ